MEEIQNQCFRNPPAGGRGTEGFPSLAAELGKLSPLNSPYKVEFSGVRISNLEKENFADLGTFFFGLKNSGIASTTCELDSLHFFLLADGQVSRYSLPKRPRAIQRQRPRNGPKYLENQRSAVSEHPWEHPRHTSRFPVTFQVDSNIPV